jgi:hypothetical protein
MLVYFEKQLHYLPNYITYRKCIRAFKSTVHLCLLCVSVQCMFFKVSFNLSVLFTSLTSIFYIYNKAHLGHVMLACLCGACLCLILLTLLQKWAGIMQQEQA